jgi:hypothetical protein
VRLGKAVVAGRRTDCKPLRSWSVIVSLLYQVTRRLLSIPAVLLRHDASRDAELLVLRHETSSSVASSAVGSSMSQRIVSGSPRCPRCCPDAAGTRFSPSNLRRSWPGIADSLPGSGITAHVDDPPNDHLPTQRSSSSFLTWLVRTRVGDIGGSTVNWSALDTRSPHRRCGES